MNLFNLIFGLLGNFLLNPTRSTISLFEPTKLTTPNLVRDAGYPIEEHQVTTEDGYILTIHRIPYSSNSSKPDENSPLPVVFLQHGLAAASTDWIFIGPGNALGYLFSDRGYDVWMGNSRGNRYSQKNVNISSTEPSFWDFSYNKMGVYDLPAVFDYIMNSTGVEDLIYVGHSQGTTEFFVYCIMYPSCGSKIKTAHLLAPVAFTNHIRIPFASIIFAILGRPDIFVDKFGSFNVAPNTQLFHIIGQLFCNDQSNLQFICADIIESIWGPSNYLNESLLPSFTGIFPDGTSLKQIVHYAQGYESTKFRQFDYGILTNKRIYGSSSPPDYDLGKVSAPLYLYHSESDFLASPPDVFHTISLLPKDMLRSVYKVPPEKWDHLDFLYGINVKNYVYDVIFQNIEESDAQKNDSRSDRLQQDLKDFVSDLRNK